MFKIHLHICSFFSLFPSIPTNYRPKTFYRLQKIQQQRIEFVALSQKIFVQSTKKHLRAASSPIDDPCKRIPAQLRNNQVSLIKNT
jgi:hypothetical protein